ncbi:hypothetical protein OHA69_41270 [Streptomyces anulatus]|uniref:hypothetical protein n=1 Tax=Streptomyces anulatus TaxID=1892 RepID=UPI00224D7A16|nr:hypothetical protein [Streptomyces anulatus]MCX4524024.1 hypothetical protein [Streptomyces anulatus]
MARTKPSAMDTALIAQVAKYGLSATPTQLERWRQQAWLPSTRDTALPGSETPRPDVVKRAAQLAHASRAGRSISWAAWAFWSNDATPDTARRLRAAIRATLLRPLQRAGIDLLPADDSEEAFQATEAAAAQLLRSRRFRKRDLDGTLRNHATTAGTELPRVQGHPVPNIFHRAVLEPGARILIGGTAHIAYEAVLDDWAQIWPDSREAIEKLRTTYRDAELSGIDPTQLSPMSDGLRGLVRALDEATDERLCAAVQACTKGSAIVGELFRRAPACIPHLMNDVMWDQWVRVGGLAPDGKAGEAGIAMATVTHLLVPGWAEDLDRYTAAMTSYLP